MLIPLTQWAAQHGKTPQAAHKLIDRGNLPQAKKIGRDWLIGDDTPYPPDNRFKKCPAASN
jgi:hypothetical protein